MAGKKIKIEVPANLGLKLMSGEPKFRAKNGNPIVERVPKITPMGNFQMMTVLIGGRTFIVGDGDEYLRGIGSETVFAVGRELK